MELISFPPHLVFIWGRGEPVVRPAMKLFKVARAIFSKGRRLLVMCECGEFVGKNKFKDYIKTSKNPSTETFGHIECGFIFNFIDDNLYNLHSSKVRLKVIAGEFAVEVGMNSEETGRFLLEVDRLKRRGNLKDVVIIKKAYESVFESNPLKTSEIVTRFMVQKADIDNEIGSI